MRKESGGRGRGGGLVGEGALAWLSVGRYAGRYLLNLFALSTPLSLSGRTPSGSYPQKKSRKTCGGEKNKNVGSVFSFLS